MTAISAPPGTQNARKLSEPGVEIGHVVEHPGRDDGVERAVGERQLLDIAYLRIDTAGARQLDHARREVDERHLGPELALHPLGELALAASDLEHAVRMPRLDRAPENLLCIGAFGVHPQRFAGLEVGLGRVLLAHDGLVVERHQAFSATKIELARRAKNGSSIVAGRFETSGDIEIDARTYSSTAARSANSSRPSMSSRRTSAK